MNYELTKVVALNAIVAQLTDAVFWWSPLDVEQAADTSDEERDANSGVKALLKACGYDQQSKPRSKPATSSRGIKAPGTLGSANQYYFFGLLKCHFES